VRPGKQNARFTALRVAYLAKTYGLRSRYDRLRDRGMLTKEELAARLGIHVATVISWGEYRIVTRHAHNGHAYLYQDPGPNPPVKQSSRWNRLVDRADMLKNAQESKPSHSIERGVV
jgi:hypothetical protein